MAAHRLQTITISIRLQRVAQRQRLLAINLRQQAAVTTEYALCIASSYLSLSLSYDLSLLRTLTVQSLCARPSTPHNMFALSHIYTNMTFWLFTCIPPMGYQKQIYKYVPSSGERFSPRLHHPALAGLVHSVLIGSSLPGTRAGYSYPIRRDRYPNTFLSTRSHTR